MDKDLYKRLLDLSMVLVLVGEPANGETIDDTILLIKKLESDLKDEKEKVKLLEQKQIRKQARIYHGQD